MKPVVKSLALCFVATYLCNVLVGVHADYKFAFLNDYDEHKFYAFYDGQSAPSSTQFSISSSAAGVTTSFATLSTSVSDANYIDCPVYNTGANTVYRLFKICQVYIGDLDHWQWRINTDVVVTIRTTGSSTDEVIALYNGRNMDVVDGNFLTSDSQFSSWSSLTPVIGANGGFNADDIGYDRIPDQAEPFTTNGAASGDLTYINIEYDEGADADSSRSGSAVVGSGSSTGSSLSLVSSISQITISYLGSSDAGVCGVAFSPGSSVGCSSNSQTYTLGSNFGFAGFVSLTSTSSPAGNTYLLLPLQYQLLRPRVAYYENLDTDSAEFTFRLFWPTERFATDFSILDTRDSNGDPDYTENSFADIDTVSTSDTSYTLDLLDVTGSSPIERACTSIKLTTDADTLVSRIYESKADSEFIAWTRGHYVIDSGSFESSSFNAGNDDLFSSVTRHSSSGASYEDGGTCTLDLLSYQEVGMDNGVLYVDGEWLGNDQGTPSSTVEIGGASTISQLRVYYDTNQADRIVGLAFVLSGGSGGVRSIGTTSGATVQQQNIIGNVESALAYVNVYMSGNSMNKVEAFFVRPAAIWNIWTQNVADHSSGFYQGSFQEEDDDDADQKEVRFWMPFDSDGTQAVEMTIEGSFGRGDDDSATAVLSGDSTSFVRGRSYSSRVYSLVAQSSYEFTLVGYDTSLPNSLASDSSATATFDTPNGARLLCSVDGATGTKHMFPLAGAKPACCNTSGMVWAI